MKVVRGGRGLSLPWSMGQGPTNQPCANSQVLWTTVYRQLLYQAKNFCPTENFFWQTFFPKNKFCLFSFYSPHTLA